MWTAPAGSRLPDVLVPVGGPVDLLSGHRVRTEFAGEGFALTLRLGGLALVGRHQEQAVIRDAVAAAAGGSGGVLFLVGEAGIGKTRLADEAKHLASGQQVLRGRATSPSVQYRALREAFMAVLRRTGPPDDPQLVPYLAALSRLVPEWQLTRPPGVDDSPVVLAEAVLRLLVSLGGEQGCVAVLEDLHDADADTLAVVDYLADNLSQERVLVVATVRTGPSGGLDLVRATRRRRAATVLELDRLTGDEMRQLAAQCPGAPAEPALTRLLELADGVPFYVEELILNPKDGLSENVADQVGPQGRRLLQAAALLGRSFPASVAGEAAGVTGDELAAGLRRAADAQLVLPDTEPDRYVFRHALTAEALRTTMLPAEVASLSRRAATVLDERDPDLAAQLWYQAGDVERATGLLADLARRARSQGAVSTAIALAERGLSWSAEKTELREVLLDALVDAGEVERAVELGTWLDLHATTDRRAAVHLKLARAAAAAGQWAEGLRQVASVRRLTPDDAEADAVEAWLTFLRPGPDRMARAHRLASDALRRNPGPETACAALEVLASCARTIDLEASRALCDRGLAVAEEHGLITWRIRFLFHLGILDGIHDAGPARLLLAHDTAVAAGAIVTALVIQCELAVIHLTRGDYEAAERCARASETAAARLRLTETRLIALALRVCVAAHRGAREQTEDLYDQYRAAGGDTIDHAAAVQGLGLAFGALLDDDHERAWSDLDRAIALEDDHPPHYLSFNRGPYLLLATLAGKAGRAEHDELAASAHGQARWNKQFVVLSRAVLDCSESDVAEFETLAAPYPLAHHLGLRLIGERARAEGWGRPRDWLSAAETYFHQTDAVRVAAACRNQLRDMGVPVAQRRRGSDRIPPALRRMGVTVREHEVLDLVAERLGNKEIAARLFLSPRTVEKHVASLLLKSGEEDRAGLARFAAQLGKSG